MALSRFGDYPGINNRALQLWLILICRARGRQTTTFGELAGLIGMAGFAVPIGMFLGPIAAYCLANGLPPLTALVLQAGNGTPPGLVLLLEQHGLTLAEAQEAVFDFNRYSIFPPTPVEFGNAPPLPG